MKAVFQSRYSAVSIWRERGNKVDQNWDNRYLLGINERCVHQFEDSKEMTRDGATEAYITWGKTRVNAEDRRRMLKEIWPLTLFVITVANYDNQILVNNRHGRNCLTECSQKPADTSFASNHLGKQKALSFKYKWRPSKLTRIQEVSGKINYTGNKSKEPCQEWARQSGKYRNIVIHTFMSSINGLWKGHNFLKIVNFISLFRASFNPEHWRRNNQKI